MTAIICGVDEAGRGPLAGKVFAAAVILNPEFKIKGLTDSKKLSPNQRAKLFDIIISNAIAYSIKSADEAEIEQLNILNAALLAMKRAVESLSITPTVVQIDGNKAPKLMIPTETIVQGDLKIAAISAASILAKVARDRDMLEIDKIYPEYGFANHKGYGTKEHLAAIAKFGVLSIHRKSFSPIKYLVKDLFNE